MNKARRAIYAAGALLLVTVGTRVVDRHRANQKVALENAQLCTNAALLMHLQKENERLRAARPDIAAAEALSREHEENGREQAELEQLRHQLAEYDREQEEEVEKVRREIAEDMAKLARGEPFDDPNALRTAPVTGSIAISEAQNKGASTPEDLLVTWLWAVEHGNAPALRGLHFWPADRKEELPSNEAIFAMDANWLSDVTEVVLKRKTTKGDDEVIFNFELRRDRDVAPPEPTALGMHLRRFGDVWKIYGVSGSNTPSDGQ